ncbi:MAG: GDP-L-fucose synthase [Candidatus Dadabacteria bacterium]|nr:MAG: GDP-L-fucose synthase [Candidatus Dadabacteria bacterium]
MDKHSRIYVAGHAGLVGSSIVRNLKAKGYNNIITRTKAELDLRNQALVNRFFAENEIDYVFLAAARVGGILYNQRYQADFIYDNITIAANVIHAAAEYDVKKLLFLGSSCIYPKMAPQPIKEEYLLSGPLEPTNEGYAVAKIAGLKLCEKFYHQYGKCFISCMPTNLYGPGDNFHPEHSHVIPGMMRRFHTAKLNGDEKVVVWGSGKPRREFLHVDDLAEALFVLMEKYDRPETINVGTGIDHSILEVAEMLKDCVGFKGRIELDTSKPDGTPRKVLDVSRIKELGWEPKYSLEEGLRHAYQWAVENRVFDTKIIELGEERQSEKADMHERPGAV